MNNLTAKVIEKHSGHILFECPLDKLEEAYSFALRMEEMDIETNLVTPGLTESLALELGSSPEQMAQLNQALEQEMNEHPLDQSCCIKI